MGQTRSELESYRTDTRLADCWDIQHYHHGILGIKVTPAGLVIEPYILGIPLIPKGNYTPLSLV